MKDIIAFLSQLKDNNNKEWFSDHKKQYEKAKAEFIAIVEEILRKCSSFEPSFNNLKAKECIFRINRDIRFSPDKSPYKTNFGASFNPHGKKSPHAGYYLHLQPGESFVGGGIYLPSTDILKQLRQEVDYNFETFERIIHTTEFKRSYPAIFNEDRLARPPKGYEASNPAIEFLKLKHYIFTHNFDESEITSKEQLMDLCVSKFQTLKPFNDFLNQIFYN